MRLLIVIRLETWEVPLHTPMAYYYVLNVDDGDTVTISATKNGWNYVPYTRTFQAHGNSISQGRKYGAAPSYDVAINGFCQKSGQPARQFPAHASS